MSGMTETRHNPCPQVVLYNLGIWDGCRFFKNLNYYILPEPLISQATYPHCQIVLPFSKIIKYDR